ncbi:hypothetical protein BDR22DRAFT_826599 [Usnea florida]
MSVRQADMTDLDAMVDVCLAALAMDPQWDFRLRYREQYPEDTVGFMRKQLKMFLENEPGSWQVRPADQVMMPPSADKAHAPATTSEAGSSEQRRDADRKKLRVFEESLEKARTHYFKQVYGENRMQLRLLVTHPDYQRRGAGEQLVKWGIEKAKEDNLAVTLFAGSTGGHLYRKLGFRGLGVIKIQVDGEIESVSMGVMAYLPTCDEA